MEHELQAKPASVVFRLGRRLMTLKGENGVSPSQTLRRWVKAVGEMVNARWSLRHVNSVGLDPRVSGRLRIENHGTIETGDGLRVISYWTPTEFITGTRGRIEIGNSVWINFGAVIAAHDQVKIGDRVMIGQHCIISDVDFPELPATDRTDPARGIEIGDDAWLANRVTVRPGVKIGKGAVVIAGSIVETDLPPHVIAGGIPARPLSKLGQQPEPQAALRPAVAAAAPTAALEAATPVLSGYLIADFTIDELVSELRASDMHDGVASSVAPFGQVTQTLLSPAPIDAADFAVVWTRPDGAIPSFASVLSFETVDDEKLGAEVDRFCSLLEGAAPGYRAVFVPTWTPPNPGRGLGMLDARTGGATRALATMNLRLMERLSAIPNVYVLNASRWFEAAGPAAVNPKAWYLGKIAVARPALAEAARDIRAALQALTKGPRKLLVLDLDDTLWGGIVGDVGWEGLRLGGLDGTGEAFVDFQKAIRDLKRRGVVLGIVSKNEESVALDAIRRHPAMILREEDFVGWRINWNDKASNILDLTRSLNLGLQSVVFIDDNPAERARVREALPEVYVPDWPKEEFLYSTAFRNLRCFDAPALTLEDMERTRMYGEESRREALRQTVGSIEEWLKTLDIRVRIAPVDAATSIRAAQLLNKTNQLNLTTRRLTENELLAWANRADRRFWVVSVSDRLGDAGLTGLLGMEFDGDTATVIDFVLSCRVMGRRVEETMVHVAVAEAAARSARTVVARYLPTAKNKPCLSFWQSSRFDNKDDTVFSWNTAAAYALPDAISLDWKNDS